MKYHKVLSTMFFCSLLVGLVGFAWIYVEGTLLGSSDPNIGAGGLMLVGFAVAILSGLMGGYRSSNISITWVGKRILDGYLLLKK
ncbi:MAG: hypothetical protein Q3974_09025 [Rothia sp. (in: high G+C Gram-positive bacteria)]|nr:hypothetical protein [Rothia sp. (in: high G+C Gram-positive bacteria)]